MPVVFIRDPLKENLADASLRKNWRRLLSLKPKGQIENKPGRIQFIKYCEEEHIDVYEIADFDTLFCEYVRKEFEQRSQDSWDRVNKIMSSLQFSLSQVKRSLHRSP